MGEVYARGVVPGCYFWRDPFLGDGGVCEKSGLRDVDPPDGEYPIVCGESVVEHHTLVHIWGGAVFVRAGLETAACVHARGAGGAGSDHDGELSGAGVEFRGEGVRGGVSSDNRNSVY